MAAGGAFWIFFDSVRNYGNLGACLRQGPCTSGIDCCSGFCSSVCTPPPSDRCSERDEHCERVSDCCESSDACVNGFCAFVPLL